MPSAVKQGAIAALLSLFIPGLGQIYNGHLRKAFLLAASLPVIVTVLSAAQLPATFAGLIAYMAVESTAYSAIAIEAAGSAVRQARKGQKPLHGRRSYLFAAGLLVATILAYLAILLPGGLLRMRAYRVPSGSMTPTVMIGDRIVADRWYFRNRTPRRSEIVVVEAPEGQTLLVKRVIAVAGDVIAGDGTAVLLNGRHLLEPYLQRELGGGPRRPSIGRRPAWPLHAGSTQSVAGVIGIKCWTDPNVDESSC